jgi:hypothetical protein
MALRTRADGRSRRTASAAPANAAKGITAQLTSPHPIRLSPTVATAAGEHLRRRPRHARLVQDTEPSCGPVAIRCKDHDDDCARTNCIEPEPFPVSTWPDHVSLSHICPVGSDLPRRMVNRQGRPAPPGVLQLRRLRREPNSATIAIEQGDIPGASHPLGKTYRAGLHRSGGGVVKRSHIRGSRSSPGERAHHRLIRDQHPSRERITDAFLRCHSPVPIHISQLRQHVVIGHHQMVAELMKHREVLPSTSGCGDIADSSLIVKIRAIARTLLGGVAARHRAYSNPHSPHSPYRRGCELAAGLRTERRLEPLHVMAPVSVHVSPVIIWYTSMRRCQSVGDNSPLLRFGARAKKPISAGLTSAAGRWLRSAMRSTRRANSSPRTNRANEGANPWSAAASPPPRSSATEQPSASAMVVSVSSVGFTPDRRSRSERYGTESWVAAARSLSVHPFPCLYPRIPSPSVRPNRSPPEELDGPEYMPTPEPRSWYDYAGNRTSLL